MLTRMGKIQYTCTNSFLIISETQKVKHFHKNIALKYQFQHLKITKITEEPVNLQIDQQIE